SFTVAASGGTVAISFRDAVDNSCTSGTLTTGTLSSCSPTCSDGIQNGNETGIDCGGPDCSACPTCSDGVQNGNETGVDCGGPDCPACPTAGLQFEQGTVAGVGTGWTSVPLTNTYTSMVVVATVELPNSSSAPVVTRIQNASGSAFEVRIQNPSGASTGTYVVHYFVVEEGVYTLANDGIRMEAVRVSDNVTSRKNSWSLQGRSYQQAYTSPIVVGQVMTYNDADWSVFWTATSTSRTTPPSATSFSAGKHVGEDPDITRAAETLGYVVVEAGSGTLQGTEYVAGLGSDIVRGVGNTTVGYTYGLSGLTAASSAVVSAAALDGGDGGWPVLYGGNPFTSSQLVLAFDEDQAGDSERSHTSEQVAYLAFGASAGGSTCSDGIQNGNETGVDCGGPDCPACPTCSDGIQNGNETDVDCGGPDCLACPTCSDGVQNGNETGVDCGGPDCPACSTCSDGIQNGDETGVDCGGSCPTACPTCSDGTQNGNETGVDCGGPDCAACPTCSDGVQNGNETGVDCGGPDCAACPVTYCTTGASTQYEHIQSVTVAGTTNTSGNNNGYADFTGSVTVNLNGTASVSLTPGFPGPAYNEFWTIFVDYNADGDFTDGGEQVFQGAGSGTVTGSFVVPNGLTGTSRMRIMMQYNSYNSSSCGNFSWGEVEDYNVNFGGGAKGLPFGTTVKSLGADPGLELFPNPASTDLTVRIPLLGEAQHAPWFILDATGKVVLAGEASDVTFRSGLNISLRDFPTGVYYFSLNARELSTTKRFVVQP
ncbi:MAG: GEVED domain-containing protein, partial [Bacteroidota bacterium]